MLTERIKNINRDYLPKSYLFSPKWIVLGVNNVCNLHCKMCDVGTQNMDSNFAQNLVGTHPMNMPLDLIKRIIDDTVKYYPKSKLAYGFTEPLVYPDLISSLQYAQEKGLKTAITTNALTLKQKASKILEAGLSEIFISLDGTQDVHNEIRGHQKSYQKAIEGIEILKQSENCPKISIICAITEWNYNVLQDLIEDLKKYDIDDFAFMHTQFISKENVEQHQLSPWGDLYPSSDSNMDIIDFSNLNIQELHNEIERIRNTDYPFKVYFAPDIKNINVLNTYYNHPEIPVGKKCDAVFSSMMIKSDGSVIPAHGRCYNIPIGNIYKENLKEIWNSTGLTELRSNLNKAGGLFPACNRCCSAV